MTRTLVIAEAGVNHNGNLDLAYELVDAAALAGADVVKFQTFQANKLATKQASTASYQERFIGKDISQLSMLHKLELSPEHHLKLLHHCQQRGIEFLSTAFDFPSLDLLAILHPKRWKIPSGEITNLPYLRFIGSLQKPIILSSGMACLGEIEAAITVLEKAGTSRQQITVLHCTTEYPAPYDEVNLLAMQTIANAFNVTVGYSDHTDGIIVPVAAVALGAVLIEKHLTLSRSMDGPDHRASLEPSDFAAMVQAIRTTEFSLGDGIKAPTLSEQRNLPIVRKSLVAATYINAGDELNPGNITAKRPGTGISPMHWDSFIGQKANRDYSPDDLIQW